MAKLKKQTERFIETAIDDEVVVMELDGGSFFSLSGTALAIWTLIDGSRDRAALLAQLSADYVVPQTDLASEVDAFLADLAAAGLVANA